MGGSLTRQGPCRASPRCSSPARSPCSSRRTDTSCRLCGPTCARPQDTVHCCRHPRHLSPPLPELGGEGRGGEGRGGEGRCGTPRLHNVIIALKLAKELENMKYPPPASPLGGTKFLPHWPKVLLPKVKMVPCWVRTQVWERPMATWLTGTPSRAVTTPGEEGKRRGDSGIVLQIQSHIQQWNPS